MPLAVGIGSIISYIVGLEAAYLLPVISLCACDSGTGGGAGGGTGGSGSGSGSGGAGSGADTQSGNASSCACCESSSSDCCETGNDDTTSSPYLCVWNGSDYEIINDVLVAPGSYADTPAVGEASYNAGAAGADVYALGSITPKAGELTFQLREIEPEESFIDRMQLQSVEHPIGSILVAKPNHSGYVAYLAADLTNASGVVEQEVRDGKGVRTEVNTKYGTAKEGRMLEVNEVLELRATVKDASLQPVMVVSSRYRDWAPGLIDGKVFKATPSPIKAPLSFLKAGAMSLTAMMMWVASGFGFTNDSSTQDVDGLKMLGDQFGHRTAQADYPHNSLVVEYWNWKEGHYMELDIIRPRSLTATLEAVTVPKDGVGAAGEVAVRVRATKRHMVDLMTMFVPRAEQKVTAKPARTVTRANHSRLEKDFTLNLQSKHNGYFVHLVPGDVLDISFGEIEESAAPKGMQRSYFVQFDGFYTALSHEGRQLAGDWISKLDDKSKSRLHELYALGTYYQTSRSSVYEELQG